MRKTSLFVLLAACGAKPTARDAAPTAEVEGVKVAQVPADALGALTGPALVTIDAAGEMLTGTLAKDRVPCEPRLRLVRAPDDGIALLTADASAPVEAVLAAWFSMPQPAAIVARGDTPEARALPYVVDGAQDRAPTQVALVSIGDTVDRVHTQLRASGIEPLALTRLAYSDEATARDLALTLAALAQAGVEELVVDHRDACSRNISVFTGGDLLQPPQPAPPFRYPSLPAADVDRGPKVRFGLFVEAEVDQWETMVAVRERFPRIRACYDIELRDDPTLDPTLQIALDVAGTGEVTRVDAHGGGARLKSCVIAALDGLRLPPPALDRGARALFELELEPGFERSSP